MKPHYLPLAAGRLRYLDNQGNGPTLVFCHDSCSAATSFSAQFAALGSRYRLIALDFLGHGGSQPAANPPQAYSFAGFARSLIGAVELLGLEDYVVIGHGLGGHAALEALPRLHGLLGLVLEAAPPFNVGSADRVFRPDPGEGLAFQASLKLNQVSRLAAALVNASRLPGLLLAQVETFIHATDPQVRSQLGSSLAAGRHADHCQRLRDSGVPALLLQGKDDAFIDWRHCTAPDSFPGCNLGIELFESCGHTPHIEQAERFNALLEAFVAGIAAKTR